MSKYIYPDDRKKEKEGYCSWCFQLTKHDISEEGGILNRSKYQCRDCSRETIQCRRPTCHEFARVVPNFREERCYLHRRLIKNWHDKEGIDALHPIKYCSNCFNLVTQKIVIINPITGGRTYECTNCKCATCHCKECDEAFALNDVEICAKCQGGIEDWSFAYDIQKNKQDIFMTKVCSWCLEESKHICRNVKDEKYQCLTCTGETKPCKDCDYMMAKKECAKCALIQKDGDGTASLTWDALMAQKKENDEKYEDWGKLMEDLHRPSNYFTKARNAGVIRPYLILILMHPRIRIYIGMSLGLVLSKLDDYLDAHAEAWYILSHRSRGLIARSTTRNEKVNYFGRSADWYLSLYRVMTMYVVQSRWVEMPEDTLGPSINEDNDDMIRLELVLIKDGIDRQTKSLTDVARTNLETIKEHNQQYKIFKQLLQDSEYYKPGKEIYTDMQLLQAFQQFSLHLKEEKISKEEAVATNIMAKYAGLDIKSCGEGTKDSEFSKTSYFVTRKVATKIPMIATKQVLASFVPILGWAVMANNLSKAILRETVDVCAIPIREMLLHHSLLTARGVEIEEFYHLHEDL